MFIFDVIRDELLFSLPDSIGQLSHIKNRSPVVGRDVIPDNEHDMKDTAGVDGAGAPRGRLRRRGP